VKEKKILFISPTPTHPTNAGNRQHIKSLVSFFKEQNWEVHFLYLAYEDFNYEGMYSFFGNNLHVVSKAELYQNRKTIDYVTKKLYGIFFRFIRKFQYNLGSITKNQFIYNSEVDYNFSVFVKPIINALQKEHDFTVVVCEYAFVSKSLELFDKSVFKILDTHDRFTNRYQTYLNNKSKPSWVSLFEKQEKKALKRADLILAVNQNDAEYFSKLSGKKTLIFNYIPEIVKLPKKLPGKKLLYIASANDINLVTITLFIEKIFPLILKQHPGTTLIIGGSICEKLTVQHSNIFIKGKFENLASFYSSGDIVINPEISGTGYKIKAMEALSYGMPLVATRDGAAGAIHPDMQHLIMVENEDDFAKAVIHLLEHPEKLETLHINAHEWIKNWKHNIEKDLKEVLA